MGDYSSRYHLFTWAFVRVNKNRKLPGLANSLQTPETPDSLYTFSGIFSLTWGEERKRTAWEE